MFTKSRRWRRWSGPRTEVTAAIKLASAVLEQWSEIPSKIRVRITYDNQLTETSDDLSALDQIHSTDLRRIKTLWIEVGLDENRWSKQRTPDMRFMDAAVALRLADAEMGMRLEVRGPDRTNVEGLMTRLGEVLDRSTAGPTNLPIGWGMSLLPGVAFLGALIGTLVTGMTSGSLSGLRLCMVMHLGNSGGSRAWQACRAAGQIGESTHPRSTGVRKASAIGRSLADVSTLC